MPTSVDSSQITERGSRANRSERRRRLAAKAREAVLRLSKPSPLPPHPEGLAPSIWPVLAATVAIGLSVWNWVAALIAVGLVLAYAIGTRNDRKRQLLYAYIQGHRQFKTGDFEAALTNFTDMEEADFAPPAVLRAIGLTNYQLGHWAEAATYLEDVPSPTDQETVALAHAMMELGEAQEAATIIDRLETLPAEGIVVRSVIDLRLGRPHEAVTRLEPFLAEAGGANAPAAEPYLGARYWLGVALKSSGHLSEAEKILSSLHDLDPTYHDVGDLIGRPTPGPEEGGTGPV